MTIKDIIVCNGFGFKGVGDTHWACGCSSHYSFPPFPQVFLVTGEIQATYAELKFTPGW